MKKLLELIPLKLFVVSCIFLASFFIFVFIADQVVLGKNELFDNVARQFFIEHSTPGVVRGMRMLTFLGSGTFLFPGYVLLIIWFLLQRSFRKATHVGIIASGSFLVMQGLKQVFHRQRPESAIAEGLTNYSFPSGHSLSAFVFCSILAYLSWTAKWSAAWKWVVITMLFFLAVSIGVSRIVLNVHYATDVVGGFCLGVMWVILSFAVLRKFTA